MLLPRNLALARDPRRVRYADARATGIGAAIVHAIEFFQVRSREKSLDVVDVIDDAPHSFASESLHENLFCSSTIKRNNGLSLTSAAWAISDKGILRGLDDAA